MNLISIREENKHFLITFKDHADVTAYIKLVGDTLFVANRGKCGSSWFFLSEEHQTFVVESFLNQEKYRLRHLIRPYNIVYTYITE